MCWSCIHVGCICVTHICGLFSCCIYMVSFMVAVMSPCESGWCVVGCVYHEYRLVMHVSV